MAGSLDDELAAAMERVAKAADFVARQRAYVDGLRATGSPLAEAEQTLALYVRSLKAFEDHLHLLQAEVAQRLPPPRVARRLPPVRVARKRRG